MYIRVIPNEVALPESTKTATEKSAPGSQPKPAVSSEAALGMKYFWGGIARGEDLASSHSPNPGGYVSLGIPTCQELLRPLQVGLSAGRTLADGYPSSGHSVSVTGVVGAVSWCEEVVYRACSVGHQAPLASWCSFCKHTGLLPLNR